MLSLRFYLYGGKLFQVLGYFGVLPYAWDSKTGNLKKCEKLQKKSRRVLALLGFWQVYLFLSTLLYYQLNDFTRFNFSYLFFIGGCLIIACFAMIHWPNNKGLIMFNTILDYSKYIDQYYTSDGKKSIDKVSVLLEIAMLLSLICCVAAWLLVNLFFAIFPEIPVFVGSFAVIYLHNFLYLSIPIRLAANIYHLLMSFNVFMSLAVLQIFVLISVGSAIPFFLKELNVKKPRYLTIVELRTPTNLMKLYREAQIYNKILNQVLGYLLVPAQTLITQLVMFVCFLMSKHRNIMGAPVQVVMVSWAVLAVITWIGVLEVGGYLIQHGENLLTSWKYHSWESKYDKTLMNKFRRSCKPIMINHGRTYSIKRITVLKYLRGLIKGVFRTLLTLGK